MRRGELEVWIYEEMDANLALHVTACSNVRTDHITRTSCAGDTCKAGKGNKVKAPDQLQDQTPAERRASMNCAQRLKRVFNIDIETCRECGGAVKVITCIEDPVVIEKILTHLNEKAALAGTGLVPASRAPP